MGAKAANADAEVSFNRQWAEACFSEQSGALPSGPRLSIVHEDIAGDTKIGRCAAGGPLRLGDQTYRHGIGVNSQSTLRVSLPKRAKTFSAVIGLDRNVDGTAASVRFSVKAGYKNLW
ncbi:MAG: NPCBM/NEW2 domain-containing protein, partial [Candidatus Omnitrophica bacterium]|nr:NPCBM/NEW2 domain-containing protein [Candidatus Omnitrophota bacterium]